MAMAISGFASLIVSHISLFIGNEEAGMFE